MGVLLAGDQSEAATECYGMQALARVARGLGASPGYGRWLARYFWRAVYPTNSPEYKTKNCRNGGRLDLHPSSNRWP